MIATFHGDDPELATPVLERVCNQATIMEQPATTPQPPSNEVTGTTEMFRPSGRAADSFGHDVRDRRLRQRVVAGLGQAADALPAISSARQLHGARQTKH